MSVEIHATARPTASTPIAVRLTQLVKYRFANERVALIECLVYALQPKQKQQILLSSTGLQAIGLVFPELYPTRRASHLFLSADRTGHGAYPRKCLSSEPLRKICRLLGCAPIFQRSFLANERCPVASVGIGR